MVATNRQAIHISQAIATIYFLFFCQKYAVYCFVHVINISTLPVTRVTGDTGCVSVILETRRPRVTRIEFSKTRTDRRKAVTGYYS